MSAAGKLVGGLLSHAGADFVSGKVKGASRCTNAWRNDRQHGGLSRDKRQKFTLLSRAGTAAAGVGAAVPQLCCLDSAREGGSSN